MISDRQNMRHNYIVLNLVNFRFEINKIRKGSRNKSQMLDFGNNIINLECMFFLIIEYF